MPNIDRYNNDEAEAIARKIRAWTPIENMNTHEKRIFTRYSEALNDYNLLATTDNRAHGCWRLIALLKEQIY